MPFIHRLEFLRTRLLCSLILAFHTISNMINDSCELAFKRFISEYQKVATTINKRVKAINHIHDSQASLKNKLVCLVRHI